MATSYQTIYTIFLNKINDFDLPSLNDAELGQYCYNFMIPALSKIRAFAGSDFENRNDLAKTFVDDLADAEIEAIACQMVVEWTQRSMNNTQLLNMFVSTKDESMTSQANHINSLIALRNANRAEVNNIARDYEYNLWVKES